MKRLLVAIFLLFSFAAFSQPQIKAWLSADTVRFAQPVWLYLSVEKLDAYFTWDNLKQFKQIPDLPLVKLKVDTAKSGNLTNLKFSLELLPLKDTVFELPELELTVGGKKYKAESLRLVVLPIERDSALLAQIDTQQTIDIFSVSEPLKAPWTFKEFWLRYRYWILGLLLLLLLLALAYWLYRRYKQRRSEAEQQEPQVEPHILILQKLQNLKSQNLCAKGLYKEFYSQLSELIRQYVEYRYRINALELTTSELERLLEYANLFDVSLKPGFFMLLKNADLVKFAKYKPLETTCRQDLDFAIKFIEQTAPKPEPQPEQTETNEQ